MILWDGMLLSPEGKGGGGEGGASPPSDALSLSVERGSRGSDAVEGGGPCNVRATYVPAMGQHAKVTESDDTSNKTKKKQKQTKLITMFHSTNGEV